MKIGQKMLVIEVGALRDQNSNEFWSFHGKILGIIGLRVFGRVVEAINFPESPLRLNQRNGTEELCFNGTVLVKIRWPQSYPLQENTEYGVGVFWVVNKLDVSPIAWRQMGCVCLLSDIEGKRYLRKFIECTKK